MAKKDYEVQKFAFRYIETEESESAVFFEQPGVKIRGEVFRTYTTQHSRIFQVIPKIQFSTAI